jgi:CheY-like chemotaxis protein
MINFKSTTQFDILIIDDDAGIRYILEKFLRHFFSTYSLSDGKEALLWLTNNKPRVIITDLDMPNLNGVQFLKNLKSSLIFQDIKIFVVTGHDNPELMRTCNEYGINDYIIKPFNPLNLVVSIYNTLEIPIKSNKKLAKLVNQT